MRWRVYYATGTYSDEDGPPELAPGVGAQVIVKRDTADPINNIGRRLLDRADFYWWDFDADEWYGGDIFGLFDYLQRPGLKKVIFGRSITTTEFTRIRKLALDDPDFPRHSGG